MIHSIDVKGIEGPVDVGSPTGRLAREGGATALRALSDNTGGRFVQPRNDFGKAFEEVDAVSRHYYVLAFEPTEPAPKSDRPRALKVRVRREGLRVSHRPQYLVPAASPDPKAAQLVAAEAIAKGLSGGRIGLDVVALPYRDRDGRPSIPAVLRIEGEALAAAGRNARGEPLKVHVYGYAIADGRVVDTLDMETTLDAARAGPQLRQDGFRVLTTFAAAPGPVELRFFVRAGEAGDTRVAPQQRHRAGLRRGPARRLAAAADARRHGQGGRVVRDARPAAARGPVPRRLRALSPRLGAVAQPWAGA